MKIDTMRRIDYWSGIPLCFLASLWLRLFSPSMRPIAGERRHALFVELSEMGSTILADPAMRKLRDRAPAELFFLIFRSNRESLDLLNTVPAANVYTIRCESLLALAADSVGFLLWARRRRIDTVIDLELFSRYSALLCGLSGAAIRIGFHAFHNEGLYRGDMLTHRVAYNPHQHMARNFIALVNAALAAAPELPYSKTLIDDAELLLERPIYPVAALDAVAGRVAGVCPAYRRGRDRLVLLNANASDLLPQRRWPIAHFAELARRILERWPTALILLTGAPDERGFIEELRRMVNHERCASFAGEIQFRELPVLYSLATLMVTNDSGPGHFAAITSMPTFTLFGPETPALYGGLGNSFPIYAGMACSPCVSAANHRKTACTDNVCLQVISPDDVLERIRPVMERTP